MKNEKRKTKNEKRYRRKSFKNNHLKIMFANKYKGRY